MKANGLFAGKELGVMKELETGRKGADFLCTKVSPPPAQMFT